MTARSESPHEAAGWPDDAIVEAVARAMYEKDWPDEKWNEDTTYDFRFDYIVDAKKVTAIMRPFIAAVEAAALERAAVTLDEEADRIHAALAVGSHMDGAHKTALFVCECRAGAIRALKSAGM